MTYPIISSLNLSSEIQQILSNQISPFTIKDSSPSLQAYISLANALYHLQIFDSALKLYNSAHELSPENPDILSYIGMTFWSLSDLTQAETVFIQAIEINPTHLNAQIGLGFTLKAQSKHEEALEVYNKASKILINHHLPKEINNTEGNYLATSPDLQHQLAYYRLSILLDPQGDKISEGIEHCNTLIDDYIAYYTLGLCYASQNNQTKALESYQKSLQINPKYAYTHLSLAELYFNQGDLDKTIASCQQTIDLNPNIPRAFSLLGLAYLDKNLTIKASQHLNTALQLNPNHSQAYFYLGMMSSDQQDYSQAIEHFKKVLTVNPKEVNAYFYLGQSFYNLDDLPQAIEYYSQGLEINPNAANLHYGIANVYIQQGNFDLAAKHYVTCIQLDPYLYNAHFKFAQALHQKGDFQNAIGEYLATVKIKPDYIPAYLGLGKIAQEQ